VTSPQRTYSVLRNPPTWSGFSPGEALVFHARALESLLDRAMEETRLRSLGIEGPLAIGVTPITAAALVPEALALLLKDTPDISVTVTEGLDDELVAMLRARELDLVVSRLRPGMEEVETEPLVMSDWALITNPRHPLARRESLSLSEVTGVRWVVPAGGSAFRRQMGWCSPTPASTGRCAESAPTRSSPSRPS
jgi:LysR family transcriptional regulator of gallate degradation